VILGTWEVEGSQPPEKLVKWLQENERFLWDMWFGLHPEIDQFQALPASTVAINSILPFAPTAGPNMKMVTVNGSGFQRGLTVTAGFPGGGGANAGWIASPVDIEAILPNDDYAEHNWPIHNPANNPDGSQSNIYEFAVAIAGEVMGE
jgi:hypothetical protein